MAKKSVVAREKKRRLLVLKYEQKRSEIKKEFKAAKTFEEKFLLHSKLQKLPRNSAKVRQRNRCWKTGRSRAIFRDFGLCRQMVREMALQGLIPGVIKSSW